MVFSLYKTQSTSHFELIDKHKFNLQNNQMDTNPTSTSTNHTSTSHPPDSKPLVGICGIASRLKPLLH